MTTIEFPYEAQTWKLQVEPYGEDKLKVHLYKPKDTISVKVFYISGTVLNFTKHVYPTIFEYLLEIAMENR